MTLQLPPERDLPPHRARDIEAALVDQIVNGPRTARRRWLVPAAAAAAVVVTLGTVVGVLRSTDRDEVTPVASDPPSASVTPSAQASPTPSVEQPTGQMESIVPGCVDSYAYGGPPEDRARTKGARLYNLLGTPSDGVALIYADSMYIYCRIGGDVMAYNAGGGGVGSLHWLPGAYRVDYHEQSTMIADGIATTTVLVGGRATDEVARVTVQVADDVSEAQLQNGTFLATAETSAAAEETSAPGEEAGVPRTKPTKVTVRAYDADGRQLTTSSAKCMKTPDGELIDNDDFKGGLTDCIPAVAWP
ncbi:hypothetical protein [Cryptosporangium aurantiacum]|uniref:Uncharacterized protein n=1 Tax=Cryptosporangium aurantiacum TaxID=134849 RepID=A0A1M7MC70_9ACTN|nr:hypothetical protein [Cryptosporangium aurantiacum]SHM87928.1 hypothetical protein SAMN05443668_10248 [Cryptosporangium aurantiacum]